MHLRLLAAFLILSGFVTHAAAQTSGSVYVHDRFGDHLEGNSFERLDAVFFSAGRGLNCLGTALADGEYYFQVTDPAGTVLLTPDALNQRKVLVSGGQLEQYLGTTRLFSSKGNCESAYVRLFPILPSPYDINEFKLWLTRVQDYDPQLSGFFGFDPALSKSDNFRVGVRGQHSILRGRKFYDHNQNAIWDPQVDPLEVAIGGWRVELYKNNVLDGVTFTDQDGWYIFVRERDSFTVEVREVAPGGFVNDAVPGATWLAKTPKTGTAQLTAEYVNGPTFGNVKFELKVAAGRTPAFWDGLDLAPDGNLTLLLASDPIWRAALNFYNGIPVNLRTPFETSNPVHSIYKVRLPPEEFTFAFQGYRLFIAWPSNDHAGHLLSREVSATLLSHSAGFMQGSIMIDRHGDGVLVSLDEMIIGVIGLLSDPHAGETGPNTIYQDLRHMMQMCTNEFGRINESGDQTAPQVVYDVRPAPPKIETPYEPAGNSGPQ